MGRELSSARTREPWGGRTRESVPPWAASLALPGQEISAAQMQARMRARARACARCAPAAWAASLAQPGQDGDSSSNNASSHVRTRARALPSTPACHAAAAAGPRAWPSPNTYSPRLSPGPAPAPLPGRARPRCPHARRRGDRRGQPPQHGLFGGPRRTSARPPRPAGGWSRKHPQSEVARSQSSTRAGTPASYTLVHQGNTTRFLDG